MKFQLFYWIYFVLIISSINVFAHDEEPKYIRAKRGVIADSIKNGLINCALNKAMGGSCRQGFKAGIIATGASAATNKVIGSGGGGFIQDTLRGAIVSGITSKAMGGSATEGAKTGAVANGAMGALSRLLNRNN